MREKGAASWVFRGGRVILRVYYFGDIYSQILVSLPSFPASLILCMCVLFYVCVYSIIIVYSVCICMCLCPSPLLTNSSVQSND